MARKCCVKHCDYPVFGTDKNTKSGYCKSHQYLRTDLKTPKSRSKSYSEQKNKYDFDIFKWGFTSEIQVFLYLWHKYPHISMISGRKLPVIWILSIFAHVLNKKDYPLFRLNPDNVMMVHPDEHGLIDSGTTEQRKKYCDQYKNADFSIFYSKKELLLTQYKSITKN